MIKLIGKWTLTDALFVLVCVFFCAVSTGCNARYCVESGMSNTWENGKLKPVLTYEQSKEVCGVK